jgi:hypothetical protein
MDIHPEYLEMMALGIGDATQIFYGILGLPGPRGD